MNRPGTSKAGTLQERLWKEFSVLALTTVVIAMALMWLAGCNTAPKSDQELKDQAARTTQQVKQDAQETAANAKVAAAQAERKVDDIAAGVKEGLNSDKPAPGRDSAIDINSAGADRLSALPGISASRAQRIVDGRPYAAPHDLVVKGIVSEAEYERISGRIVAQ